MSTQEKVSANYTAEMVQAIEDAAPLNLVKAKALALVLDRPYRSVIAKAKSIKVQYDSLPTPAKKEALPTKAELVSDIEANFNLPSGSLEGVVKSTVAAIKVVLSKAQEYQTAFPVEAEAEAEA
jgi:hypothetical protein